MINFSAEMAHRHLDYRFDKIDRFDSLLPYLYPKLSGDWDIELIGIDIRVIRRLLDNTKIPDYLNITIVIAQDVLAQVQLEYPSVVAVKKTVWEYYNDLIAKLPIYIESKASSMLYNRLPKDKILLRRTLEQLAERCEGKGSITVSDVKGVVISHRFYYSNQVIRAFSLGDKNRWTVYNTFVTDLGQSYAFYALKKYVKKLLKEKSKYLQNDDYRDKNVEVVDTYTLVYLYQQFNEANPNQLLCIFSALDARRKGDI